jgi:hypothetical protein
MAVLALLCLGICKHHYVITLTRIYMPERFHYPMDETYGERDVVAPC